MNAETMTDKPAPCPNPWCASHKTTDVEIRHFQTPIVMPSGVPKEFCVACPVCPINGPSCPTEAEALTAWNARTVQAELVEADIDWRVVARLAGEHGIRYRTNKALVQFLNAITRATGAAS